MTVDPELPRASTELLAPPSSRRAGDGSSRPSSGPSVLGAVAGLAGDLVRWPLQRALDVGVAGGRAALEALAPRAERAFLAAFDAVLASPVTEEALDRLLDSPAFSRVPQRVLDELLLAGVVEQIADRIVNGPELPGIVAAAVDGPGLDRAVQQVLDGDLMDRVVERVLASELPDRVVERVLASELPDRVVERVLTSELPDRLVVRVLDSPLPDQVVEQVLDSRLPEVLVSRLLESEQLWVVVEEIARSEAVADAINRQSIGFADQVADEVRVRSGDVDAWLERAARRVIRRRRAEAVEPVDAVEVDPDAGAVPEPGDG